MSVPDKQYPLNVYRLILMTAAAVWGLGFVIGKSAIATVGATWFTAIRFLGAGIVLVILLFPHLKRNFCRKTLKAGLIIGVATFMGFWTQFLGLGLTTPSKNAFLSACYCLTVPFIWWVVSRRRPPAKTLIAAAICTVGIGLVSLTEGFSISLGDGVSIASAVLYGAEIVIIGLVMRDNDVLALLLAFTTQPMPTMTQVATPEFIGAMTYVAMLSAAFGAVAQNTAQAHLSPSEAGLLCSLESVFCALFSVVFFGEVLTARMAVGFAFIFAAIVATQLGDKGGEAAVADSGAHGSAGCESPASGKPAKRNRGRIAR